MANPDMVDRESQTRQHKAWILLFFKGFAMGAANVIPGVSGGTVAFITGIYERLINALKSFDVEAIKLFFRGQFKAFFIHIDFVFLFILGLGVIFSIFSLAKVLDIGFKQYPIYISALFFGLILASIPSVGKMVKQWGIGTIISLLIGLGIALSMTFAPAASQNTNIVYLMLCGVVAMCSMIIPGVSGSFVLLLMGNYQLIMIDTINSLREGQFDVALPILVPVAIGAILGLIVLSRLLSWLFSRHHDNAVAMITGFVAGSLAIIWPWKSPAEVIIKEGEQKVLSYVNELPTVDSSFFIALGILFAGAALMIIVENMGSSDTQTN
jgi:putative membrane protein